MAYCIKCGTELVQGAEFCFSCGTRVPDVVFKGGASSQEVKAEKEVPASAHCEDRPQSEQGIEPAPKSSNQQPSSETEPSVKKEQAKPEIMIDEMVTADQIARGESIVIRDSRLAEPISIRLQSGLKDGSKLRVKEARVRILNGEVILPVIIRLQIKNPVNEPVQPPHPAYDAWMKCTAETVNASAGTQPDAKRSSVSHNASYMTSNMRTQPTQEAYHTVSSAAPVTWKCVFEIGKREELGKFKLGGADEEGHIDIYDDRIVLYRINKMLTMGLGIAGHLIAGKGAEQEPIYRNQVIGVEKELNKKGQVWRYYLSLSNGQVLKLTLLGFNVAEAYDAMERFLRR